MLMHCVVLVFLIYSVAGFLPNTRPAVNTARFLFGMPDSAKNPVKKEGGGGGFFGNMGNMMETMKKAQDIAKQGEALNKELQETLITGSDPSNQAQATFTGLAAPIAMKISETLLAEGAEKVSLAATQALLDGYQKSSQTMMSRMQALYSQFGLPIPPQK